jgi:hypothetical protein
MTTEAIILSTVDLSGLAWRKSSRSGQDGSNGNCVEVAFRGLVVAVRDSKSPEKGALTLSPHGWVNLLVTVAR